MVNSVSDFYILNSSDFHQWTDTQWQLVILQFHLNAFVICQLPGRCSTPQVAALVFMLWSAALTNRWPRQAQLLWGQVFTKAQILSHLSHCLDTFVAVRRERNE